MVLGPTHTSKKVLCLKQNGSEDNVLGTTDGKYLDAEDKYENLE